MLIDRLLPVAFAAFLALGTLLLGMGQREYRLAVLAAIVSASSVVLTDRRGWLVLDQRVANWAGLLAVGLAGVDWYTRYEPDSQLLALANLLVYLQFVLLYRRKQPATYWQLTLLNLMQVAVAAALNLSPVFAAVLLAYLVVGVVAHGLFYLQRERLGMLAGAEAGWVEQVASSRGAAPPAPSPAAPAVGRWFAALGPPVETVLGWSWLGQLAVLLLGSLGLSAIFFLLVPRSGGPTWQPVDPGARLVVGVTESITLGEVGRAFESPEATMRVAFFDFKTGERFRPLDEPYFRGLTLSTYDRGVWSQTLDPEENPRPLRVASGNDFLWYQQLVRQQITIEPLDSDVLFAVFPLLNPQDQPALLYDRRTRQLVRAASQRDNPFSFEVVTPGFATGRQEVLSPALEDVEVWEPRMLLRLGDEERFPTLIALARQVVAEIPEDDWAARAAALERELQASGRYFYSLDLTVSDPALDPIEDFVKNTRSGHCEYFASALALMLRAVGIPARVVIGFKGGDWNALGSFYQVRQLHTHAWVEAYLPRERLPRALAPPKAQWRDGGWLRLDATPVAGRLAAIPPANLSVLTYRQMVDYVRHLWTNYILGLDAQRQREAIYRPLALGASELWRRLRDPENWRRWFSGAYWLLRGERSGWFSGEWFNWRAGLSGSAICLVLAGLVRLGQLASARWLSRVGRFRPGRTEIAFQRRLEELLATYRPARGAGETQREYALASAAQLRLSPTTEAVARVPLAVVQAFYRVRFGGTPLDSREAEAVEQGLDELAAALAASASAAS